jgi:aspartate aminotransferase, mitochondrial
MGSVVVVVLIDSNHHSLLQSLPQPHTVSSFTLPGVTTGVTTGVRIGVRAGATRSVVCTTSTGTTTRSATISKATTTTTTNTFLQNLRGGEIDTETDTETDTDTTTSSDTQVVVPTKTTASATTSTSTTSTATTSTSSSTWGHVPMGAPDAILGIAQAYRDCTNPLKVNVCVGAYRDEVGQPYILPSVQRAEQLLLEQQQTSTTRTNKEYLPIEGDVEFLRVAMQFAYGTEILPPSSSSSSNGNESKSTSPPQPQPQQQWYMAAVQSLSGTGACRIGGHFLQQFARTDTTETATTTTTAVPTIYIPVPTWGNHWKIFQECGLPTQPYRYYNSQTNQLDFDGLMEDLQNAPNQSIILLHACAHNPTGCDPTHDQWEQIANVMAQKQHVCFFDSAYQGFASGNAELDAYAIRYMVQRKDISKILLAQSFAKNFGLYGERCGTLSVVCHTSDERDTIVSQLKNIIRPMYSSPPKHGSSIVKTILQDPLLSQQYYDECRCMSQRIGTMRMKLVQTLQDVGSVQDWTHITNQIGMFAYTGMTATMCDTLTNQYAIYLTRDGRISLAGLNDGNLQYVANAIHTVTHNEPIHTV